MAWGFPQRAAVTYHVGKTQRVLERVRTPCPAEVSMKGCG